ncbi:MAG: integrase arm-type DNA-binding domain-containing protein [Aquabacterium sp.]|jgi:integrase|uniref:tyrosine-type recombinase/integrase n=1 Tax=Aquabacterium sp. TaxID=1872578 RepID=UPI003BAF8F3F
MPKRIAEMSALGVSRLKDPGLHFVGGVAGLGLQVTATGARSWVLRIHVEGKRREMGLGAFPDVTLSQARDKAREQRQLLDRGIDPVEYRLKERRANAAAQASSVTFEEAAKAYIAAHESGWRNAKHGQQWTNTLTTYAYPEIGQVLVRDIGLPHILKVLESIWKTKTETATRLRGRLEAVLDWSTARDYRQGLNPARWRGHLDKLLPKPAKVTKVEHHAALPVADVGGFISDLRQQEGMGARALEFAILTAARSGEVRGATKGEIDLDAGVWIVPAVRMKAGKEHRVPLSQAAIDLVKALPKIADSDLVFTSPRGGQLSDMTLTSVLRRMEVDAVPHGFRSTFRDWTAERTSYPRDMAEMALAHTIGDKVEAAYRRGDMLDKRRQMMEDWAAFCATAEPTEAKVTPLKRKTAA